ncbi:ABC transporter substrate-binding protein [Caenispirillum bisanense]|uniref:ABC transporter substrate-binding protein n=1 Tax=Caenispirillum bisanense TaxID=414052 RepID=UPI0031E305BC
MQGHARLRGGIGRLAAAVAVAALTALAVVACRDDDSATLRLAINPWPGYEFLYLARDLGFLEEEGLTVEFVERPDLGSVRAAFEGGKADAMTVTLTEVLQACDRGPRCPRVVLAADYSDGADVVMAVPPIKVPGDLRGRRVAVEPDSATTFLLSRALETAGLSLADVTVVPLRQRDMLKAVSDGRIDAVVSYPPAALDLARSGRLRTIFSSADVPGEVVDVVAIDPHWLTGREAQAEALVRAWDRAVVWWRENHDEAVRRMAEREKVSVEEMEQALASMKILRSAEQRFLFVAGGPLERSVRRHDLLLRRAGLITGSDRTAEVITDRYLQMALNSGGLPDAR